jgi:hypothetical protein
MKDMIDENQLRSLETDGGDPMNRKNSYVKSIIVAAALGAAAGGIVVIIVTKAIPKMASQVMAGMMQKMTARMKECGISMPDI